MDMIGFSSAIPSEVLQLIVGIYVIEILILLGMFANRIYAGIDYVSEHDSLWKILLGGIAVYVLVIAVVSLIFMPLISVATTIV